MLTLDSIKAECGIPLPIPAIVDMSLNDFREKMNGLFEKEAITIDDIPPALHKDLKVSLVGKTMIERNGKTWIPIEDFRDWYRRVFLFGFSYAVAFREAQPLLAQV